MFSNPFNYDDDATSTVFRDIIFLALFGFMAIVLLIISHINPPTKESNKDVPPPGNMVVEMFWDDALDLDIDLWVQAPEDKIVGYSSKSGKLFNLLRDDLGFYVDQSDRNYEIALTRGLRAGEYTINVMYYANKHSRHTPANPSGEPKKLKKLNRPFKPLVMPVEVKIIVSIKKNDNADLVRIIETTVELWKVKEEITATNFKLNSTFDLIRSSVNNIYKRLATPDPGETP